MHVRGPAQKYTLWFPSTDLKTLCDSKWNIKDNGTAAPVQSNHSSPSSDELKHEWNYSPISPVCHNFNLWLHFAHHAKTQLTLWLSLWYSALCGLCLHSITWINHECGFVVFLMITWNIPHGVEGNYIRLLHFLKSIFCVVFTGSNITPYHWKAETRPHE